VELMLTYPEFRFACSQAQQLAWIKADHPRLWEKLQTHARSGQFVPVGGTWVEPDCNVPSGESLVRQFLLGQRFFKKEFGAYCNEFWNPDVFGYSGALPQILRKAEIGYFLTQKLSWNQFNRPANSTFLWEGIDGSRVLTHFPPSDTYNAIVTVEELLKHYRDFKENDRASESLMLFGYGDGGGGGGPTEEMLERLRRVQNVAGLPEVAIRPPREFFTRCERDIKDPPFGRASFTWNCTGAPTPPRPTTNATTDAAKNCSMTLNSGGPSPAAPSRGKKSRASGKRSASISSMTSCRVPPSTKFTETRTKTTPAYSPARANCATRPKRNSRRGNNRVKPTCSPSTRFHGPAAKSHSSTASRRWSTLPPTATRSPRSRTNAATMSVLRNPPTASSWRTGRSARKSTTRAD
jgi:hypothetical protein